MHTVAWMLGAVMSFCLMAVGVRELSGELPVFQTLFIRSLLGLMITGLLIQVLRKKSEIRLDRVGLHIFRNCLHFIGQYGWFIGIAFLPLAEVFALEFTTPIWTMVIASLFIGEKITREKIAAIVLGVLGVLVIVRPGVEIIHPASFIVLAAAACYGASHTAAKSLSITESPLAILFFMSLVQLPIGLIPSLFDWVFPLGIQWLWLSVVGFGALSAHYCLVRAMLCAEVGNVIMLDFLRLPMIAVMGAIFYQEGFEIWILLGATMMLIGNWASVRNAR